MGRGGDSDTMRRKGYSRGGPWGFRGEAHYQFHLVKSSTAREFVPEEMPLVEAFGHTLGGFYYARYEDSPAGPMDELVVLSGLVWNAPTSCAWASHVFVDRKSAVSHGKQVFGLPSHLVNFHKTREGGKEEGGSGGIERVALRDAAGGNSGTIVELVRKVGRKAGAGGPKINFQLPSFSGRTKHKPDLLKYDLDLSATIQPSRTFSVDAPRKRASALATHVCAILGGPRLGAFTFRNMAMSVRKPKVVAAEKSPKGRKLEAGASA